MEKYLRNLISGGEGLQLDFKYCISDSRKIARTLSSFANTEGGTLLIGVRDNRSIAGISSEEEYYMIEAAASLFCKPEISFRIRQHIIEGKTILEVDVEKGTKKPYLSKGEDGKWLAYFRHGDQNLAANNIMLQLWRKNDSEKGVLIRFGKPENSLMEYLKENPSITFSGFKKLSRIPAYRAEKIIVNLLICNVLEMNISEKGFSYSLSKTEKGKSDNQPDHSVLKPKTRISSI
jgi:predicted HTH transcriptional regulator